MKFSLVLVISFLLYLIPELLFRNTMLYLSGGIIGGTISEVFKNVSDKSQTFITFLIWIIMLIGFVFLFFRLNYKPAIANGMLSNLKGERIAFDAHTHGYYSLLFKARGSQNPKRLADQNYTSTSIGKPSREDILGSQLQYNLGFYPGVIATPKGYTIYSSRINNFKAVNGGNYYNYKGIRIK